MRTYEAATGTAKCSLSLFVYPIGGDRKMAKVQRVTVEMVVEDEAGNQVAESRVIGSSTLDASYDITNTIVLATAMIRAQADNHIDRLGIMAAELTACVARLDAATDRLGAALAEVAGRA